MTDLYREEVLDHYHYPRNSRKLNKPDVTVEVSNSVCGDNLHCQLKIDDHDRIEEVAFWGTGCVLSLASASMLSDKIKGRQLSDLLNIGPEEFPAIIGLTGSLVRLNCLTLPLKALQKAIKDIQTND